MPPAKKVLVVDDDVQLCQLTSDILEEHGYQPLTAYTTDEGFQKLYEDMPDLIILDVWLPSIGGFEFCRRLRATAEVGHIPIIMLTAQDTEMDKVMGLEMGADDYMTKPFSQKELLARIKALLRRFERVTPVAVPLTSGDLAIDLERHTVKIKSKTILMTPKELRLLITLIQNRKKVVNRQTLLNTAWGEEAANTGTLEVHIRHLRKKLGSHGEKIKTIMGFGYKFEG